MSRGKKKVAVKSPEEKKAQLLRLMLNLANDRRFQDKTQEEIDALVEADKSLEIKKTVQPNEMIDSVLSSSGIGQDTEVDDFRNDIEQIHKRAKLDIIKREFPKYYPKLTFEELNDYITA